MASREELRAYLVAQHTSRHAALAREVKLKRWQRATSAAQQARTLAYLAGDPVKQAEEDLREATRHPRIWAHCVAWAAEEARLRERAKRLHPGCGFDSGPFNPDPIARAFSHFRYLKYRAFMPGAYGMARGGDPINAALWDSLCETEEAA
jgi:hypothetical protein